MRPKSMILLSLALGCGLVASVGINQVMSKGSAVVQAPGEKVAVLVAKKDINLSDLITPDLLTTKELPKELVPKGALTKIKEVEDRRAATKIIVDEIVMDAKLMAKGEKGRGSDYIPTGMRSVAIKVDASSTSGYLIQPGDHVDLMVYLNKDGSRGVQTTMLTTFLQNVRVLATDDVLAENPDGRGQKTIKTISMLVTPDQAELVTIAEHLGKITLSLRSPKDTEVAENTVPKGAQSILSGRGASEPDKKEKPPEPTYPVAKVTPPPKPDFSLFDSLKGLIPKAEPKKEHVTEIVAGAEVTRWKIVEGSSTPVKITDGAPADVDWTKDEGQPLLPPASHGDDHKPKKRGKNGDGASSNDDRV